MGSTPQRSFLRFEDISLRLDQELLFDRFSLSIPANQCTCILGPSGCGKSTLLRLITGAQRFDYSGTLHMASGQDTPVEAAWMSQKDLLLPWSSVLDNVLLGARLRGEVTDQHIARARELIVAAGLAGYENALPATLSGGMRQRVALLRTLMEQRPIILMDEPFSALDALTRMKLQNLSAELTSGATVVLVTHDPLEALRMGDTVVVLSAAPPQVKRIVTLTTPTPRPADHPEVVEWYATVLNELLQPAPL